ncbi:MAG: S8 family serine peptidase [Chloroflexi bacterium]|nr:S8 family serine peptidase [Chloroflexota bacterium]
MIVLLLGYGTPFVTMAQDETPDSTAASLASVGVIGATETVAVNNSLEHAVTFANGNVSIIVELTQTPASEVFAQAGGRAAGAAAQSAAAAQVAVVQQAQAQFLSDVAAAGINATTVNSVNYLVNAVTLSVPRTQVAALAALPNVRAVYPDMQVELDLTTSTEFIGAPQAWATASLGGAYTGAGTVVAVVDTGIDYIHTGFGGSGVYPDPFDSTTLVGWPFPSAKVIGGFDFVGDAYNAGDPANSTPFPDPNPMDCNGHGSHVAGISAGTGVNLDGSTYTGGYESVPFGNLRIGPGVAPEASLLAMRVFGCGGSSATSVIVAAWDAAVSGIYGGPADILNNSLGSGFGYGGNDPTLELYIRAVNNALAAGTLVVSSAGNSFDTFFITGRPGSIGPGISTASVFDATLAFQGVEFTGIGGAGFDGVYPANASVANPASSVVGPLPLFAVADDACQSEDYATFPAGHAAYIIWTGNCGSNGLYAAALGAADAGGNIPLGMIVVDTDPPWQGANTIINLSCGSTTPNTFPCYSVSFGTGQIVEPNVSTGSMTGTAMVTFDPTFTTTVTPPGLGDSVAASSSRGPRRQDISGGIKPDVTAPGASITSVDALSGDGPLTIGGTSMAAPHIAGVAALLMSNPAYAGWTVPQLKALIMNTANNDVFLVDSTSGPRIPVSRAGAGRVDVVDAFSNEVIAYNALAPELVSVSFGHVEAVPGSGPQTYTRNIMVQNLSATDATYDLSFDTYSDNSVANFTVSPASINVPANSTAMFTVTLTVDIPAAGTPPANFADASLSPTQSIFAGPTPRHYLSEESGNAILTPTSGATVPLRVPVYAAPRAAGDMRAAQNPFPISGPGTGVDFVGLAGTGVFTGTTSFPEDIVSSVSAFRLMDVDPLGDTNFPTLRGFDIEYVGIASNYFNGGSNDQGEITEDTRIFVAIATDSDWDTLNEARFRVYIDPNQDGFGGPDDFTAFVLSPSANNQRTDVQHVYQGLSTTGSGTTTTGLPVNTVDAGFNTYLLQNNVLVMPIDLGATFGDGAILSGTDTDFNFYVDVFDPVSTGEVIDQTDVMTFDLADPFIDTHFPPIPPSLMPVWDDVPGNSFPFFYDLTGYPLDAEVPPALLLLHHHNLTNVQDASANNFRRAEVVPLDFDEADISVEKTGPASVAPGGTITYDVTVTNNSAGTSAGVTMTDALPPEITYSVLSVSGATATCSHDGAPLGGTVTCNAVLNAFDSFTVSISGTVDPNFVGELVNTANVTVDVVDGNPTNNSATATTQVPPAATTLISPLGTTVETSPLFSWDEVFGADWYYMELYDGSGALAASAWFDQTQVCNNGVCTADPGVNLVVGNYTWFIQTWNAAGGFGPFSAPGDFTVAVLPGQPTLIAPLGTISDTMPSFSWNEVAGANGYSVWVSADDASQPGGTTLLNEFYDAVNVCNGGVCEIAPGLNLSGGTYNWWVRAWSNISGFGPWSNEGNFAVAVMPQPTTLIAPLGAINTQFPLYSWTMEADVSWYYLWVSSRGQTVFTQWYQAGDICDPMAMTCMVDIGLLHPSGPYTWWVQTYSTTGGFGPWSTPGDFTVATPPGPATPIAPFGTIAQTQPTFSWFTPLEATWFQLWVSGPNSSLVLNDVYERAVICTGDTCAIDPGLNLTDGAAYRWWVRTWNAEGGFGPWTGAVDFAIDITSGTIAQPGVIAPTAAPPVDAVPGELPGGIFGQ